LDTVNVFLTAISALAAAVATIFAFRSIRNERSQFSAETVLDFRRRYAAPEFARNLRLLRQFRDAHGETFATKFAASAQAGTPEFYDVDGARRAVTYYFEDAERLHREGFIDLKLLRIICGSSGRSLFHDVATPMNQAINATHDSSPDDNLRNILPPISVEIVPIPPGPPVASPQ
jgi:hypothetical protein